FFQAEDGIRDFHVTGVQTCALPILPLLEMEVAPGCDNATYLHALAASLDQAASRWPGLRTAAFGDLLLEDLRAWRREQLDSLGWALLTPLFRFDTAMLARRMVDSGVRASLCCV